jgi:hypothetical protein
LTVLGALTLAAGVVVSFALVGGGVDFPVLYVMGRGLVTGTNVYLPEHTALFPQLYGIPPADMLYPPATGFVVLPLVLLPYGLAKWTFAAIIDLAVILGIRALARTAARPVPAFVWMSASGVTLLSAAMRWNLMLLQMAPLILGLLGGFVYALHTGKTRTATALAVVAMALKMTLALPFVGLLALRRRWTSIALVGLMWAALNAVGFWRLGPASFATYQHNVAALTDVGDINSPDLWRPVALPRLDWMPLLYSLTDNMPFARAAALALSAASALWLAWYGFRTRHESELRTTALFLGALVCLGSLGVYHHQYDAILVIAPALLVILSGLRPDGRYDVKYWLSAPLLLMILLLPIGKTQNVLQSALGLTGVGLLKMCFPVAFTLALISCVLLLRSQPVGPRAEAP